MVQRCNILHDYGTEYVIQELVTYAFENILLRTIRSVRNRKYTRLSILYLLIKNIQNSCIEYNIFRIYEHLSESKGNIIFEIV